jgi:basic membrane protein A
MKKLYSLFALLIVGSMLLAACGGASAPDCAKPDVICVGLVTDVGKVDDKSFNQSSWEAMQQAKTDGLVNWVQYIETVDSKDYGKNLATFGDAGYDIIVTSGYNLGQASIAGAKAYPNIAIIAVDQPVADFTPEGETTPTNYVGLVFNEDQAGFLVGALAAMMSETHKIGSVCGTDLIPPVWRYGEGYRAGAAYIDAQKGTTTEVSNVYHSDVGFDKTFDDPEWGATTANAMIDQDADVIFGVGGKTGNGAVTAAAARGAYVIGVDVDQYYALPEAAPRMISSAMKLIKPGVYDLTKAAAKGNLPGGANFVGPAGYAPFHDLDSKVPADVKAKMEEIFKALSDGSLKTGVSPAKPAE